MPLKNKKYIKEICIISESTKRRPYASKIKFVLPDGLGYGFDGECSLLLDCNFIVRIKPEHGNDKQTFGKQRLTAIIEGFATACEAEKMGLKLSMALLWAAVSQKWPLRLDYHTPQPCMVFDRNKVGGRGDIFSATISMTASANKVSELINQVLTKREEIDQRLLISMELFASARLESTERAKFLGLVSSLEPLAVPQSYNNSEINNVVSMFVEQLKEIKNISDKIKDSVIGRALSLKNESISQAILRYVESYFPDQPAVIKIVKEAYEIRSNILHNGTFDVDLEDRGKNIEDIIRFIYSKNLNINLLLPYHINMNV